MYNNDVVINGLIITDLQSFNIRRTELKAQNGDRRGERKEKLIRRRA